MKKVMSLLIACTLVLSLGACGQSVEKQATDTKEATVSQSSVVAEATPEAPKPMDKLRIAYHPNMGGSSAIITGIKKGFFKEQNLEIELVKFTAGPPEVAAMISGDIDAGYIGNGAHFLAAQGKVKIISIDVISKSDEILVRKDLGITKIEDLKGKTIATQFGTSGEIILELALKRANMTKKDVKLINMDMAGAVSAFVAKKVDAVVAWSPYTVEIKKITKDNALMIANNTDFKDEFVFPSSWIATPEYVAANEEKLVRFLNGLLKAMDYRAENLDEVVDMVATLNNTPKEAVIEEKASAEWLTGVAAKKLFEDGTAKKWYEKQEEVFVSTKKLDKVVPVEDFVAFDLMKKVTN